MPTGRAANIAETLLLYVPRSPGVRTDTGTMVCTTRPSTDSPRETSRSRKPRAITASTTSLTLPPCSSRIALMSVSRPLAQAQWRCGPIGPLSDESSARRNDAREARHAARDGRRPRRQRARAADRGDEIADPLERLRQLCRERRRRGDGHAGRGRRPPRLHVGGRRVAVVVEQDAHEIGGGHAVDHHVVDLADQRPPAFADAFGDPHLPQRLRTIQLLRHHPPDEVAQLLIASRGRQRGAANVVARAGSAGRRPRSGGRA